jgi:Phytanoyl-CoA dioxygenase (PhyH)
VSVDRRARVDGPRDPVDAHAFFGDDLPAVAAAHAEALAPALRWYRPRPLTIACAGGTWTLRSRHGRLAVDGGGGGPVVRLASSQLTDLVHDLVTPLRWFGDGSVATEAPLSLVLDWWVLLRGALDGTAPYVPGTGEGGRVPAYRRFGPDDDRAEMARFLEGTGYLHLSGVFRADEMAAVSEDIDRASPGADGGDGADGGEDDEGDGSRSWWAVTDDGRRRLARMLGFERVSGGAGAVMADSRLTMIGELTGDGHTLSAYARPGMEALVRPPGTSDTAWHKDCAFGRHSYDCASLTVGVAVSDADEGSGHLRVLAGSHRHLLWPAFVRPGTDLPMVDLPARAGDVTVHLSCTAHMARPPVRAERRALYTAFGLPPRSGGAGRDGTAAPSAGVA